MPDRDRFIHHITLTTGHTRRSYRDEVDNDAIQWLREGWNIMSHPGKSLGLSPAMPGYWISAEQRGKALTAVISQAGEPVVTFAIAAHSRAGAPLWRHLIESATTPIVAVDCPPEPWCAARLEVGAIRASPDALLAIGDLERCVAWMFLEMLSHIEHTRHVPLL